MNMNAHTSNEDNYKPNRVTQAYKVLSGHAGKASEEKGEGAQSGAPALPSSIDLVTLVQLPVRDLRSTVPFYVHVLGMELDYPDRPLKVNAFLSTKPRLGPGLHLLETPAAEFRHLHGTAPQMEQEYAALYVKSVDELYSRLSRTNTAIMARPASGCMSFLDPEGHLIGVFEWAEWEGNERFESNVTGFRHVRMVVADVERTAQFFERALGFRRETAWPVHAGECYLAVGESCFNQPAIRLVQADSEAWQPMHWMLNGKPRHALELHSSNIRALRETVQQHGAIVKEELEFGPCGGYLKFYTPDGHYIWVNQDRQYGNY